MRSREALIAAFAAAGLLSASATARADPQVSAGVTLGGAVTDLRADDGPRGAFHLGARADVLFLRSRDSDAAIGPYVDLVTERFSTIEPGAGAEALLPAIRDFPFVISAGGSMRHAPALGWEPALVAGLFFGPRGYDFHGTYAMANGLFVQGRYGLGDARQADVIFGVQIDFEILALPFLFAYEAVR